MRRIVTMSRVIPHTLERNLKRSLCVYVHRLVLQSCSQSVIVAPFKDSVGTITLPHKHLIPNDLVV